MIPTLDINHRTQQALASLLLVGVLATLQACGFQLRGHAQTLASSYPQLAVSCNNKSNWRQCQYLRASLDSAGTEITSHAEHRLSISKASTKQRAFTLRENATAAEYELTHSVKYQLRNTKTDTLLAGRTVTLSRIYRQNASRLLAKDREKEEIELAIDKAIVDTILREIALQ